MRALTSILAIFILNSVWSQTTSKEYYSRPGKVGITVPFKDTVAIFGSTDLITTIDPDTKRIIFKLDPCTITSSNDSLGFALSCTPHELAVFDGTMNLNLLNPQIFNMRSSVSRDFEAIGDLTIGEET